MLKVISIDDEPLALKRISNLINEIEGVILIDQCSTGEAAVKSIINNQPDLIFIDVNLNDMTGFDVLSKMSGSEIPFVVFVSAFEEHAIKAFDLFAFSFMLKPFKDERFFKTVNKVIEEFNRNKRPDNKHKIDQLINYIENKNYSTHNNVVRKLLFKYNGKFLLLEPDSIGYISASGSYAEIYTLEKKYLLRESLNSIMLRLDSNIFYRIHRSTIINLNLVDEMMVSGQGEIEVKMNDKKMFKVSKPNKHRFLNLFGLRNND